LSDDLRNLQIKAGVAKRQHNVRQGQYRNETPAVHAFRKYAITEMHRAGVDEETAKMMSDHTPQVGVRVRYLDIDWKTDLLPQYKKAISRLTFSQDKIDKMGLIEIKDREIAELQTQVYKMSKTLAALEKWALHNDYGGNDMTRGELEDLFNKNKPRRQP